MKFLQLIISKEQLTHHEERKDSILIGRTLVTDSKTNTGCGGFLWKPENESLQEPLI